MPSGLNYMVLGNHESDFGHEISRKRVWESNFPVLASNVIDQDGLPVDGTVRTAMINVGPFRVGVMGLVTPNTKFVSYAKTDEFLPVMVTAKKLAKELKGQGTQRTGCKSNSSLGTSRFCRGYGTVSKWYS